MENRTPVLILGGGIAGLSAGVWLAEHGHPVTLLEKRGRLGGRANSFRDPVTGEVIDNGQHLLMGCYRSTLSLLEKLHSPLKIQKSLHVPFLGTDGPGELRCPKWPAPFHLLMGILSFKGLPWQERLSVLKMKKAMRDSPNALDKIPVSEWLRRHGQGRVAMRRLWEPLCLAALNEVPARSSAALFHAVLREALFGSRKDSALVFPAGGLSEWYAEPARSFIEEHGGQVLLQSPVTRLHFRETELDEIELVGGQRIRAELIISALSFSALRQIVPPRLLEARQFFHPLTRLEATPIVNVHFWFDRPIMEADFTGLWESPLHWIFSRPSGSGQYVTGVVSGARSWLHSPGESLLKMARFELNRFFPDFKKAVLRHQMVTKEPEATMAPAVGSFRYRLPQKTPYQNFFLAGDWTDTGLPATLESAARSAEKCVELIAALGSMTETA